MTMVATWAKSAVDAVRSLPRSLPPGTGPYLARAARRLRKVRTPRQAVEAFETETEHLLTVLMPAVIEHPLPVRTEAAAKALVGGTGGMAAAGQEIESLGVLMTGGAALPPLLPIMLITNLVALATEVAVAASLRVHDLEAAGVEPEPDRIAHDVMVAMTGGTGSETDATGAVTKAIVKKIAARVLARWGRSLVPFVGIAYSSWDAQRTIDAIRSLPVTPNDADQPPL
jgi:hypothetical protein